MQVVLASPERDGSLRAAATQAEVDVLVYEGGEGLRFDEFAIKAGVEGIARMMAARGLTREVEFACRRDAFPVVAALDQGRVRLLV